jgi:peroxiredoxin
MIKKLPIGLMVVILFAGPVTKGQTVILKKAIQQLSLYKSISYTNIAKQKNPFSDDISTLTVKSFLRANTENGRRIEQYIMEDARGFKYICDGSNLLSLELKNKTYSISNNLQARPNNSLYDWLSFMQNKLKKSPGKIKELPDTIINHITCYHIKFVLTDTISNHEIHDLYLNKISYLPVYTKQFLQGRFGRANVTIDAIATMINENSYSNYIINPRKFPEIIMAVPSDFSPEKIEALLPSGATVPNWKLKDLYGRPFSNKELYGQVTLIDFSFNACAACAVSIPVLNRLYTKYKNSNVKIISINILDKTESIERFVKKNKIEYPVLVDGKDVSKSFRVSGYPTFYLVDKQGRVGEAYNGYSEELEKNLVTQIDKLK